MKVTFTNPGRNRAGPEGGFSGCSVSLPTTPIVASRKYLLCDETIVDPRSRRPFRKAARNSTKASHQGRPSLSAQPGMSPTPPLGKDHTGSLLKWGRTSQGSGKFSHPLPQKDCVMPSREPGDGGMPTPGIKKLVLSSHLASLVQGPGPCRQGSKGLRRWSWDTGFL